MLFDLTIIGFGVIAVETLHGIQKEFKNKKRKVFKIAIVEKDLNNFLGGVAYSKSKSRYGYFNNPLRLSHPDFIKWINTNKNKKKIINFIKQNPKYNLNDWLGENEQKFIKNTKIYKEIYLPRLAYSFFLEDKLYSFLSFKKKYKIFLKIFNGEIVKIENKKNLNIISKKKLTELKILKKSQKLILDNKKKQNYNNLISKKILIGNGLAPPKKIPEIKISNNPNYIWDFYSDGGTYNLLKKINLLFKKKNKLKIIFIGNKAGLLEAMQELEKLIRIKKKNIKIICISRNILSLQKAQNSRKFKNFKFKYFKTKDIKKIKKAKHILLMLKQEFRLAKKNGFNKYDVWTNILNKNILLFCYKNLSDNEKFNYNSYIFPLIRKITRYTYPETVLAKKRLEKLKKLKFIKDKVNLLIKNKTKLIVKTISKKKIDGDIVINVSGPVSVVENKKEIEFVNSLKKISNKFNDRGFLSSKNYKISDSIFLPGMLSNNFNPMRETIIKAITKNSHRISRYILHNS